MNRSNIALQIKSAHSGHRDQVIRIRVSDTKVASPEQNQNSSVSINLHGRTAAVHYIYKTKLMVFLIYSLPRFRSIIGQANPIQLAKLIGVSPNRVLNIP